MPHPVLDHERMKPRDMDKLLEQALGVVGTLGFPDGFPRDLEGLHGDARKDAALAILAVHYHREKKRADGLEDEKQVLAALLRDRRRGGWRGCRPRSRMFTTAKDGGPRQPGACLTWWPRTGWKVLAWDGQAWLEDGAPLIDGHYDIAYLPVESLEILPRLVSIE